MPIYEYRCEGCEQRFETYVRSWADEVVCPSCHGSAVEKQLSTFAFAGANGGSSPSAGGGCGCGRGGCGCAH